MFEVLFLAGAVFVYLWLWRRKRRQLTAWRASGPTFMQARGLGDAPFPRELYPPPFAERGQRAEVLLRCAGREEYTQLE